MRNRGSAGFTLIEVLVVLVILGLALSVVAIGRPGRSVALDLRGAASGVAATLRLARVEAVAGNRTVGVVFEPGVPAVRMDGAPARRLPPGVAMAVTTTRDNARGTLAAIRFAPDGSSSGGEVVLTDGGRRMRVGVDWLTGRVTMAP